MKALLLNLLVFPVAVFAQNVGIGTTNPIEKLDVDGNIHLKGNIRVDGTTGAPGQVLRMNGNGVMQWGFTNEFRNYSVFQYTTTGAVQTFNIPAGVTRIKAELWGGGGYGTNTYITGWEYSGAGGGGGGYITGYFDVAGISSVTLVVGNGGATFANGGTSRIDVGSPVKTLFALGGTTAQWVSATSTFQVGFGGGYSATNTNNYIGIYGEPGTPMITSYEQRSSTEFVSKRFYGHGGNSGNTTTTGGRGGFDILPPAGGTAFQKTSGAQPTVPGGGGAGNMQFGAAGMVIIYY